MRKHFLISILALIVVNTVHQTRGTKIGYIDMEYILQNGPMLSERTIRAKAQKNGNKN
jgi:Skp family chaperone for outer membrane proteins